jgi:hypothetical protein
MYSLCLNVSCHGACNRVENTKPKSNKSKNADVLLREVSVYIVLARVLVHECIAR